VKSCVDLIKKFTQGNKMLHKDSVALKGAVSIVVYDKLMQVKEQREIPNLVVAVGKNYIAARMVGIVNEMSHMAIGSGTTAPASGNTAPQTELGRVALDSDTASGASVTYFALFPAGTGTGAVTEAAILNAASAGTMLCRTVFPVINKGADDSLAITWQVTVL